MAGTCDYLGMDVIAAVGDLVRSAGFEITAPVDLRSTNNVVIWLAPSPVVAKSQTTERERSESWRSPGHLSRLMHPSFPRSTSESNSL